MFRNFLSSVFFFAIRLGFQIWFFEYFNISQHFSVSNGRNATNSVENGRKHFQSIFANVRRRRLRRSNSTQGNFLVGCQTKSFKIVYKNAPFFICRQYASSFCPSLTKMFQFQKYLTAIVSFQYSRLGWNVSKVSFNDK